MSKASSTAGPVGCLGRWPPASVLTGTNNAPLNFPAAFNPANPVLWERPGVIMPARLAKFSFQADF
jgi:hypothetical protein